jgi:hypothetical protein
MLYLVHKIELYNNDTTKNVQTINHDFHKQRQVVNNKIYR